MHARAEAAARAAAAEQPAFLEATRGMAGEEEEAAAMQAAPLMTSFEMGMSCPLSCTPAPQPIRGDRETESGRDAEIIYIV